MQNIWIFVLLASTASVVFSSAYDDYETPVDNYEMPDYIPKILQPEDGFTKRATSTADRLAAIPRSGLMISGRGWMPGFADQPRLFKRSLLHKILVRPMNFPVV